MADKEVCDRLDKLEETQQEIVQTLRGDRHTDDPEKQGLVGRVNLIFWTLWGAPGRPNGLVGLMKEGRVIWRSIGVGVAITVIGGVALRFFA